MRIVESDFFKSAAFSILVISALACRTFRVHQNFILRKSYFFWKPVLKTRGRLSPQARRRARDPPPQAGPAASENTDSYSKLVFQLRPLLPLSAWLIQAATEQFQCWSCQLYVEGTRRRATKNKVHIRDTYWSHLTWLSNANTRPMCFLFHCVRHSFLPFNILLCCFFRSPAGCAGRRGSARWRAHERRSCNHRRVPTFSRLCKGPLKIFWFQNLGRDGQIGFSQGVTHMSQNVSDKAGRCWFFWMGLQHSLLKLPPYDVFLPRVSGKCTWVLQNDVQNTSNVR